MSSNLQAATSKASNVDKNIGYVMRHIHEKPKAAARIKKFILGKKTGINQTHLTALYIK